MEINPTDLPEVFKSSWGLGNIKKAPCTDAECAFVSQRTATGESKDAVQNEDILLNSKKVNVLTPNDYEVNWSMLSICLGEPPQKKTKKEIYIYIYDIV